MDRRRFFKNATLGAGAATGFSGQWAHAQSNTASAEPTPVAPAALTAELAIMPWFCAHEHWGSSDVFGAGQEGYLADSEAGAVPQRTATVWDIVLEPYFGGWLVNAGCNVYDEALRRGHQDIYEWWHAHPEQVLAFFETPLRRQHGVGALECTRQGMTLLYDTDILSEDPAVWQQADAAVAKAYGDVFAWYENVIAHHAISEVIRPVQPEFFFHDGARPEEERRIMHPILRIDPLLDLWGASNPRRDRLAAAVGVEPRDAASWRAFIKALFDLAADKGNVGIKQLQAYTRHLNYVVWPDDEVVFTGPLNPTQRLVFQDWVMHACCMEAHERGWPHQIHVGTHNLDQSSPLPLTGMAERYPNMKLVLLHCWPFVEEAGFLAKHHPNVYLDACWQSVLNPAFLEQSFTRWLGYLPSHKIMSSQDATTIEMAVGSLSITRGILARTLATWGNKWRLPLNSLRAYAADIAHNNAVAVYGIGSPHTPEASP